VATTIIGMARTKYEERSQRSIYIPTDLNRKIEEYAEENGISWNEAHRRILQRYFALLTESENGRLAELEKKRDILMQEIRDNEAHLNDLEKSIFSTRERLKRLRKELVVVQGELEEARILEERWEALKSNAGEYGDLRKLFSDVLFKWAFDNLPNVGGLKTVSPKILRGVVNSDMQLLEECQQLFGRKPSQCLDVIWDFEKGRLKE